MLSTAGVQSAKLPPGSPNLNAYAERFVRSIKGSCLDRLILFGEGSVRTCGAYHHERNHQWLENRLIVPTERGQTTGRSGRINLSAACIITTTAWRLESTCTLHRTKALGIVCPGLTRMAHGVQDEWLLMRHSARRYLCERRNQNRTPSPPAIQFSDHTGPQSWAETIRQGTTSDFRRAPPDAGAPVSIVSLAQQRCSWRRRVLHTLSDASDTENS